MYIGEHGALLCTLLGICFYSWDFGRGCWLGLKISARGRRSGCDFVVVEKLNFLVWIEALVPFHMLARFRWWNFEQSLHGAAQSPWVVM